VHLAYLMMGSHAESRRVNLTGSRTVFEATLAARRPVRSRWGAVSGQPRPGDEVACARANYSRARRARM
jgi:hypothetical protein